MGAFTRRFLYLFWICTAAPALRATVTTLEGPNENSLKTAFPGLLFLVLFSENLKNIKDFSHRANS